MQFSDGVKIRAQIDSDSVRAMLAVAGGASIALLAFLPYLLDKPDMQPLARAVLWGLMFFQASLVFTVIHNVLRRHCSTRYESAWRNTGQRPEPGKILGIQLRKHPGVCFFSWTLLWLAIVAFVLGAGAIGKGAFQTLRSPPSVDGGPDPRLESATVK